MTTALNNLIRSRRTIHNFTDEKIPQNVLQDALCTAQWAPNHRLTHPWQFYIIGDKTANKISELNAEIVTSNKGPEAGAAKLTRWQQMPNWLIITSKIHSNNIQTQEDYASCACLVQNLSLLLWEQGIGLKWSSGDVIRDARLYDIIGADPFAEQIIGLFWYGKAEKIPDMRRPAVEAHFTELP